MKEYYNKYANVTIKTDGNFTSTTPGATPKTARKLIGPKFHFSSLFAGIFALLLIICAFRVFANVDSGNLTFTGLLNYCSTLQVNGIDFSVAQYTITNDWGILNDLRNFINIFLNIWNFALSFTDVIFRGLSFLYEVIRFVVA